MTELREEMVSGFRDREGWDEFRSLVEKQLAEVQRAFDRRDDSLWLRSKVETLEWVLDVMPTKSERREDCDAVYAPKTIWKFPLAIADDPHSRVEVKMPRDATILRVGMQEGRCFLWAVVRPSAPMECRTIHIYESGRPMPEVLGVYRGTFTTHSVERHVFDGGDPGVLP